MEGSGMESKIEPQKPLPHLAIRCAKAAILLSKINSSPNCQFESADSNEDEEKEAMRRKIGVLMADLARERMKTRKIKLCGLMELILHVLVVLLASTFLLALALKFL